MTINAAIKIAPMTRMSCGIGFIGCLVGLKDFGGDTRLQNSKKTRYTPEISALKGSRDSFTVKFLAGQEVQNRMNKLR